VRSIAVEILRKEPTGLRELKRVSGIAYLVGAYLAEGFSVSNQDACQKYDPTADTIVLYEQNRIGMHAARLLANGMWSSKLGDIEDVQHQTPRR
jgi:hypothetical protein